MSDGPESSSQTSVKLSSVRFGYNSDDGNIIDVLANLTFSVKRGEFFGILGPSGCGKTTILRLISNLISMNHIGYFHGSISVFNGSPQDAQKRHDFSFMFQESILLQWRNIIQNIILPLQLMGEKVADTDERVQNLLRSVGLEMYGNYRISELSGGMRQRVSLARAIISDPKILLLDEPFASLDYISREELMELLQKLCQKLKSTVLLVTHNISDAILLCDRIAVLNDRPASVLKIFEINLPRPRSFKHKTDPIFQNVLKNIQLEIMKNTQENQNES